jgi:hypothetical protein
VWDTTLVPSSDRYLVRVTATDGVKTASDTSRAVFTVDNEPPKVSITRPAEGETVSGEVTMKVAAADNIKVAEVRIYAGAVPLATLTAPPYEVVWDTTVEANAPVTFRAVATDLVGLTAESTVRVTVRNTGAVSGRVTDRASGLPLAGAAVTLLSGPLLPVATTTTDEDGLYSSDDVPTGSHLVRASAAGYGAEAVGTVVEAGLTAGVDLALEPQPGAVTGTVRAAGTGRPLAGATVRAVHEGVLAAEGVTDAAGRYLLEGLAAGWYMVTASHEHHQSSSVGAAVRPGQTTTVDFTLQADPATIQGTVTEAAGPGAPADGGPIVGATVSLHDSAGLLVGQTVTGADGTYCFQGVAPGSYLVTVRAAGFGVQAKGAFPAAGEEVTVDFSLTGGRLCGRVTDAATAARVVVMDQAGIHVTTVLTDGAGRYQVEGLAAGSYTLLFQAVDFRSERTGVSLDPGDAVVVDQALEPDPGALRGTVTDAMTGEPLARAAAVLRTAAGVPVGSALTDGRGVFLLPGLAPSPNYKLTVTRPGHASQVLSVVVTAGQTTEVAVALQPQPGRVTGAVTQAAIGRPLPGVEVLAFTSGGVPVGRSVTGPDGRYLVEDLAPGSYDLSYNLDGFAERTVGLVLEPAQEAVVDVTLTADPGTIRGLVTDASTGGPLEGVEVKVYDSGDVLEATVLTDAAGGYEVPGRRPDAYTLVFALEGFGTTQAGALVEPGETVEVDARLVPGAGWSSGTPTGPSSVHGRGPGPLLRAGHGGVHCRGRPDHGLHHGTRPQLRLHPGDGRLGRDGRTSGGGLGEVLRRRRGACGRGPQRYAGRVLLRAAGLGEPLRRGPARRLRRRGPVGGRHRRRDAGDRTPSQVPPGEGLWHRHRRRHRQAPHRGERAPALPHPDTHRHGGHRAGRALSLSTPSSPAATASSSGLPATRPRSSVSPYPGPGRVWSWTPRSRSRPAGSEERSWPPTPAGRYPEPRCWSPCPVPSRPWW